MYHKINRTYIMNHKLMSYLPISNSISTNYEMKIGANTKLIVATNFIKI